MTFRKGKAIETKEINGCQELQRRKKSIGGTEDFYDGEIIVWYNNGEYMFL